MRRFFPSRLASVGAMLTLASTAWSGDRWVFRPFVEIGPREQHVHGQGPKLRLDANGTLHLVYSTRVGNRRYPTHVWSDDRGATWSAGRAVVDSSGPRWALEDQFTLMGGEIGVVWRRSHLPEGHPLPRGLYLSAGAQRVVFAMRGQVIASDEVRPVDLLTTSSGRLACHYVKWNPGFLWDHHVVFSSDAGESWTTSPAPIDADHPSVYGNPLGSIACGPEGRLFVAYTRHDGWLYCYRSDDGETWTGSPIRSGLGDDGASVAVRADGTVGVAWEESADGNPSNVFFSVSHDRGETWRAPVQASVGGPSGSFYHPALAAGKDREWHVLMQWVIPWDVYLDIYHMVSTDDGATWRAPALLSDSLNTGPHYLNASLFSRAIAVDDSGEVYVAFARHLIGGGELLYQIPEPGRVSVMLTDAAGRLVESWPAGDTAAGEHRVTWTGADASGRRAAPGLYLWQVTLNASGGTRGASAKAVLID